MNQTELHILKQIIRNDGYVLDPKNKTMNQIADRMVKDGLLTETTFEQFGIKGRMFKFKK